MQQAILSEPPGPGLFRVCRSCERWFALKHESIQSDEKTGELRIYRCIYCDMRIAFADQHPPNAV